MEDCCVRSGESNRSLCETAAGGKEIWFLIGLAPTLLLILVALRAPLDSIDRMPVLVDVIGFLGTYVPSLRGYIEISAHSQATALYFVCAWALLLPQTVIWAYVIFRYVDLHQRCGALGRRYLVRLMLAWLLLAGGIFVALYWVPLEWSVADGLAMSHSRVGLAFFGSTGFLFIALGVGFVINAISTLTWRAEA